MTSPADGIDEDRLAPHAEEREHPALTCEDPRLVAVAEGRRHHARTQVRLVHAHRRRVLDPRGGNDLPPAPVAVFGQEQSEPRVITQHCVEAAVRCLLPLPVDEPSGVCFRADRLPDLLLEIARDRAADSAAQDETEHLRLDGRVREQGAAPPPSFVERRHRGNSAIAPLQESARGQCREIVRSRVVFYEADARGHLEEVAEGGAPVLGAGERGHVHGRHVVDRPDAALRDRDPDQHRRHRLRHRMRGEALVIVPPILVALDVDGVAARDQEPGRRVAREIVVERECLALEVPANRRLHDACEARRRHGLADHAAFENLVEMALRADEKQAVDEERRAVPDRIAVAHAVPLGVGAAGGESGRGLLADRGAVACRRRARAGREENGDGDHEHCVGDLHSESHRSRGAARRNVAGRVGGPRSEMLDCET